MSTGPPAFSHLPPVPGAYSWASVSVSSPAIQFSHRLAASGRTHVTWLGADNLPNPETPFSVGLDPDCYVGHTSKQREPQRPWSSPESSKLGKQRFSAGGWHKLVYVSRGWILKTKGTMQEIEDFCSSLGVETVKNGANSDRENREEGIEKVVTG